MNDGDSDSDIMAKKDWSQIQSFSKNVTLSTKSIDVVTQMQNKTRDNFSKTLDYIIKDWDKATVMIEKMKYEEEERKFRNSRVLNER